MNELELIKLLLKHMDAKPTDEGSREDFGIGDKVFIRTVTHYLAGKIKYVSPHFITLSDAAWIADTGRFTAAIETGTLNEVEPVTCNVKVNRSAIVDVYEWRHALPREQK